MLSTEIRPKGLCHIDLAVCTLPKKKIGNPQLATGSYQQIQFGKITSVKFIGNPLLGKLVRFAAFVLQSANSSTTSIDNFGSATVVQRDGQYHSLVLCCALGRARDLGANVIRKRASSSDRLKLDVLFIDFVEFDP